MKGVPCITSFFCYWLLEKKAKFSKLQCYYGMEKAKHGSTFRNFIQSVILPILANYMLCSRSYNSYYVLLVLMKAESWAKKRHDCLWFLLTTSNPSNNIVLKDVYLLALQNHSGYFFSSSEVYRLPRGGHIRLISVYFETKFRLLCRI